MNTTNCYFVAIITTNYLLVLLIHLIIKVDIAMNTTNCYFVAINTTNYLWVLLIHLIIKG